MIFSKLRMKPKNAWNAYREYRKALGKSGNQKDMAVMNAYKALSKGKTVIDLVQVIREAGSYPDGMPMLAIARADYHGKQTKCRRHRGGEALFDSGETAWDGSPRKGSKTFVSLPMGTLSNMDFKDDRGSWVPRIIGTAIVPTIPPAIRPPITMLKNYWILWEAVWKLQVPRDPILLKHLGENLYAVVAHWDLTPIERAVLRR